MKAYLSLIKFALQDEKTRLQVFDGEEYIACGRSYKKAKDAIEAVDEARLNIWRERPEPVTLKNGNISRFEPIGWAFIIPSLAPEESVADYSANEYLDSWFDPYFDRHC